MARNTFRDLLTQEANVRVRARTWDADGVPGIGDDYQTYSAIMCKRVPLAPAELEFVALRQEDEPAYIFFEADKFITENSAGERYPEVKIEVGQGTLQETWIIAAPQMRPVKDLRELSTQDHVQVLVRRQVID